VLLLSFVCWIAYMSTLTVTRVIALPEMEEFPGGVQYHRKNEEMKRIMRGESNAIIFHMRYGTFSYVILLLECEN